MMKPFLLTSMAAAVIATSASAHECEVDLHYGVTLEEQQVLLQDESTIFVLNNGDLRRDGKRINLSSKEKQKVREYEDGLRQLVPQINAVTREALAIASEATEFAFSTLLGPDHESVKEMRGKFTTLSTEIGKRMDDQHLPAQVMDIQDEDWNIAGEGASLGWSVVGASFALVGKAMHAAFDEDYARKWEAQVKDMEKELDKRVDARAKALEIKADALCENMTALEQIETSLLTGNAELKGFDLVRGRTNH